MNDRLFELIDGVLEERLSESDRVELSALLRESAAAREIYWEMVQQDVLLQDLVRESAGRDLARMSLGERSSDEVLLVAERSRQGASGRLSGIIASLVVMAAVLLAAGVYFGWFGSSKPREDAVANAVPVDAADKTASADAVAEIRSLSGDVRIVGAERAAMKATSGQQFSVGEAVQVGEASAAEVVLTDGSRLLLSADSLLRFELTDESQRRLHLERGGAEVEAAPQSPDRPLVFTTEQARLTVLGTRFRLYAGGDDSRVELEEGKVRFERQADGQVVEVAAGQFAVASGEDAPRKPLVAESLHTEWQLRHSLLRAGNRVAFSHGATRLATASVSKVNVWSVETGALQHEISQVDIFDSLAFTPSNEAIVAVSRNGRGLFWPIGKPSGRQADLKLERGALRSCSVSRDGRWVGQTTDIVEGHLPIWRVDDAGTFSSVRSIPMKAGGLAIAAADAGPRVVASVWHGTTIQWDAEAGRELMRYQFPSQLHVLEMADDGRWIGGFGNKTGLLLIDTAAGGQRTLWPVGSVPVNWLRFSRDGRQLLAAMADGVVRAWSTADGQPLFVLATGDSRLESLDISDDGQWLAIAGDARRVTVWQLEAKVRE